MNQPDLAPVFRKAQKICLFSLGFLTIMLLFSPLVALPISAPTGLRVVDGGGGGPGRGSEVTLAWDPNTEPELAGYKVYWDIDSGPPYENLTDVGNFTTYTLSGLPQDIIYSALTAYDVEGLDSDFSYEVVINNVPLPSCAILLGTGFLGLGLLGRGKKRG